MLLDELFGATRMDHQEADEDDPQQPPLHPRRALSPASQHDPWLTARPGSPLANLAVDIWSRLEAETRRTSTRQPRKDAAERRKAIVANLLANLAVLGLSHPSGHRLAISADNDTVTRYDRRDLPSAALMKTVRLMEAQGLLIRTAGASRKAKTTLEASSGLATAMSLAGVSLEDITKGPGGETIFLKADMGRRIPKRLISYADCHEANRLRTEMNTINQALNAADIRLDGVRQPTITVVRIFQIPSVESPHSFTQYGRCYRGPWQDLKRDRRKGLTIGGEPLCDLDYQSAFLAITYALCGATLTAGQDPYSIAGLERHRPGVKRAISSLWFREGGIRRLSPELRALLPDGWTGERLTNAIIGHHRAIAPMFGINCGPALMNIESNILVAVLLRLISEGVVALGCHDGILCAIRHKAAAIRAMSEVSADMLGVALSVVEKPL